MKPSTLQLATRLCEALQGEETEMVEVLLKRGADPNLVLPEGVAPIHLAAGMEQESGVHCLNLILWYGGDPNVRSADGLTPLHVAASWGCFTCLKILLMEGGDPNLEDHDGNRAIDLAAEQGDEMCVHILQHFPAEPRQGQSAWMSHRRAESFLSTDTEHFSEIGSLLSEEEGHPGWPTRAMKDVFEDAGHGSSTQDRVSAAPAGQPKNWIPEDEACSFEDHPSSSWLTEVSQQHGASLHPCRRHALLSGGSSPGDQAPNPSPGRVLEGRPRRPKSEDPIDTPPPPGFTSTTDARWRWSPDPAAFRSGICPDSPIDSRSGAAKSSLEALSRPAAPACTVWGDCDSTLDLSQYKSFLGPDLLAKITGQEGLDATSPDHPYLFCHLDSTATLDLDKTVVDPSFRARACGQSDGCQEEGKSCSESSEDGGSSSQYASCDSECYANSSGAPSSCSVSEHLASKAGPAGSPGSRDKVQSNSFLPQDLHPGAPESCPGAHVGTPSTGRAAASPTQPGSTEHMHDRSHFREAFSKICAGNRSLDLQNTGQRECLWNVREPGVSRMPQGELLRKDPTENWDFCTQPLRESQRLTVPNDPLEALASGTGEQNTAAQKQKGSSGGSFAKQRLEPNVDEERRPLLGPSQSLQGAVERGRDMWASDTVLLQRGSEETQPLPVGESSTMPADSAVAALHHALSLGEGETPELDMRLRRMMLATKACPSPLLQPDQAPRHVTPRSKSRTAASANHASGSASLFDEALEMPRRPRRVRGPHGTPLTTSKARKPEEGLSSGSSPCRVEREASSPEDTELTTGRPRSCREVSCQVSCASGLGAPTNSRRKICTDVMNSSREASGAHGVDCCGSPEEKPPLTESTWLPREEEGEGTAQGGAFCTELGKPGEQHSCSPPRPPSRSRVSFSRLSSRGPSGVPGRISPLPEILSPGPESCHPGVSLSPGGRPVNLSAGEPVEYLYVDEDEGHTLVERHVPSTDCAAADTTSSEDTIIYDWRAYTKSHVAEPSDQENSPPRALPELDCLSDEALVRKLRDFGVNPGMVTEITRKVYVQLLEKLMSDPKSKARKGSAGYSPELSAALETYQIPYSKDDEMTLSRQFDQPDKNRKWREGVLKSSFNYLLLDPRVTQNLPFRSQYVSQAECFRTFISAIFYVGKGKRSRPYCHLYEALTHYKESQRKRGAKACPKVQHILDIWASGEGVISMHCFQNVIPVEAYTREASMVDAIGLRMLTNQKRGNYYGLVAGWPMKRRRSLGVYLLHRAMKIFLAEGERQLRPTDIRRGQ
ncbi:ankyrin repeat and LEM domain-containing protein 1 [Paroedura picta]|uniref:ankyrin repeat and LEM domain-containing protein 1 n=1 Tax=Paroedura picta TaxID=143630 RepID=UPI004056DCF8